MVLTLTNCEQDGSRVLDRRRKVRRVAMTARWGCVLLALAAAWALIAGCSSTVTGTGTAGPVSSPAVGPSIAPRVGSRAPASSATLEALLISAVPDGFVRQPDSVGDTGPSDLAKAIRDEDSPDAARVLKNDRFLRGFQRLWMNPAQDQIIVFLYQFATPAGAADFYRYSVGREVTTAPSKIVRFAVPGLPRSSSTGMAAREGNRAFALAAAATGPFLMEIVCNAESATGLQSRAQHLARQQFDRL